MAIFQQYLLVVIAYVTLGLGGTDHLAWNFPVKLQNNRSTWVILNIPNKDVPSTLKFAPYDNTLVAGEGNSFSK